MTKTNPDVLFDTNKDDNPPKPLNNATNSGIPVIWTFFAQIIPMIEPIRIAAVITT